MVHRKVQTLQIPCQYGFIHQTEGPDAFWSLSAENDWVCDEAQYGSNIMTAQGIGIIINSIVFMQLSDRYEGDNIASITDTLASGKNSNVLK